MWTKLRLLTLVNIHTCTSCQLTQVYSYTKQIFTEHADQPIGSLITHVADKLYEHVLIVEVLVNMPLAVKQTVQRCKRNVRAHTFMYNANMARTSRTLCLYIKGNIYGIYNLCYHVLE